MRVRLRCSVNLFALLILTFSLVLSGCSTGDKSSQQTASPQLPNPKVLTETLATARSGEISEVGYTLWFGLDKTRTEYDGRTTIKFNFTPHIETSEDLLIDLEGGKITALKINGTSFDTTKITERFDNHHIRIKRSELQAQNTVTVEFTHPYGTEGSGLHRFVDPADQSVYLYTDLEPYDAHDVFPCFDQPDLKATYEMTVEAPQEWNVIANTDPLTVNLETSTATGPRNKWAFPTTAKFSTYIFALMAGPYEKWSAQAQGIPTRLYARKSLAQYVDHKEWLEITAQGLEFFQKQFGYPYPFKKYDQIIVPDFNAGAMENVGAVTFSERYVYRSKVTDDQKQGRANTILHEMAHMWFGDLVTMKWWNGLWLNESFATYMAHWAVNEATRFKGSWQSFFSGSKQWGYWEDQLVTTHPIEGTILDTDHSSSVFDGVTYGKGAAVLKQLTFWIGEEAFKQGLQNYFKKHAYSNTTIDDFIGALASASRNDLSGWKRSWLQTAGVNTLEAKWACDTKNSQITEFALIQGTSEFNSELRPHRTRIALFKKNSAGRLIPTESFDIPYWDTETSVNQAIGKPCPAMVYPNYQDYDFAKVILDPVTFKVLSTQLAKLDDSFLRQMAWHTLWEMTVDAKIPAQAYADIVLSQLGLEKDTKVLNWTLKTLVRSDARSTSALKLMTSELRSKYHGLIEKFVRTQLQQSPPGSDVQLVWYQTHLQSAHSQKSISEVRKWLNTSSGPAGLKIDQERRWELIQTLARSGAADAQSLISRELKKDNTDKGGCAGAASITVSHSELSPSYIFLLLGGPL